MDRTITVAGRAAISVAPDVARVRCGVEVLAADAHRALHRSNEAMTAMIDAVVAAGVERIDIATSGPRLRRTDEGYLARHDVTVVVRDIDATGAIVDAAVGEGGHDVTMGGIAFDVADPGRHLPDLRAAAMADARATAEHLAAAGGAVVGDVVTIVEGAGIDRPAPRAAMMAATPVEAGDQEIAVAVTVTYSLA